MNSSSSNRMKAIAGMLITALVLFSSFVQAAWVSIAEQPSLLEDVGVSFSYSVQSDLAFDGTLALSPTNAQVAPSSISFSASSFIGTHLNGTFIVTGTNPGSYSLVGVLSNSTSTLQTSTITGEVNNSAPKILSGGPSGTLTTDSILLAVRTDEVSTCKYGTSDASYSALPSSFTNTNALIHNQTISGLSQGTYTYYVRCQDLASHEMNFSTAIQFSIDALPTASISLSDSSPVKVGTIEVSLKLSEPVSIVPILQYNFDDSTTKKSIALSGSGAEWKGYIIITENENNKIGSFYFSAIDSAGNTGVIITSGSIFVVDTAKPSAPSSVKSTVLPNGDVKLDWYYDGEEIELFKIYRTTSSGVQYVDYYGDTSNDEESDNRTRRYTDTSTMDKVTYYYKISAVDKAGNVGPLSEEVYATSISAGLSSQSVVSQTSKQLPVQAAQEEIPRVLPPNLIPLVNDQAKKIEKVMLDIDAAFSSLSTETNAETLALLTDFSIKQKMETSKASLQDIKAKVTELKGYYATKEELQSKLSQFDAEARKIEVSTVKSVTIKSQADMAQTLSKEDIITAANYVLQNSPLTEEEQQSYIKLNDKAKDKMSVETNVKVLDFMYMDNSQKQKTYIRKSISHIDKLALQDVVLFEFIPKSVAVSVSEITFLTPNYEVVEQDPVVKFGFLNFKPEGESISYTIDKEINIEDMKSSKSVVLLSPTELASSSAGISTGITGFVINPFKALGMSRAESFFLLAGILTVVILTGYYLLFLDGVGTVTRGVRRKFQYAKLGGFSPSQDHALHGHNSDSRNNFSLSEVEANKVLNELYGHIDVAKKTAAEHLIPALFSLHNKLDAKKAQEGLTVQEMIHLANFHADKKDATKAAELYKKINASYPSLPKEDKAAIYAECATLHRKLQQIK